MLKLLASITNALNRNTGFLILMAIIISGFFTIRFQKDNKTILDGIADTSRNTETIVAKQDQTLEAIKQTAEDNRLLSDQKTNIIICMLLVPIEQRTADIVNNCRKQAESQNSVPAPANSTSQNSTSQQNQNTGQGSTSPTPTPAPTQPPEPPEESILPFVDEPIVGCALGICL